MAAGTVSDFTAIEREDGRVEKIVPPPPEPPSSIPSAAPPAPAVPSQRKMFDENADGSIRDTSTEALKPGNALQFQTFDEPKKEVPPEEPKKEETPAPPPPQAAPPQPEKLYAGKFKTAEELEKSYLEAQRKITETSQKAAELERKVQTAPPPTPAPKTAAEIAAEEKQRNEFLEKFVANPQGVIKEYQDKAVREMQVALSAQQLTENWRKDNPDLVEHEFYVSAEAFRLAQTDPELAAKPVDLFQKATTNFRQIAGKLRTEGAKEALTTETRVTPLLSNTAPTPATEQPAKAPLTADEAYGLHLQMLKKEEQRTHRGLRR